LLRRARTRGGSAAARPGRWPPRQPGRTCPRARPGPASGAEGVPGPSVGGGRSQSAGSRPDPHAAGGQPEVAGRDHLRLSDIRAFASLRPPLCGCGRTFHRPAPTTHTRTTTKGLHRRARIVDDVPEGGAGINGVGEHPRSIDPRTQRRLSDVVFRALLVARTASLARQPRPLDRRVPGHGRGRCAGRNGNLPGVGLDRS
jgi:hypothetical protein